MISQTDLAAMLCSRLCHDMLSPVGALANGLELLADEKDPAMRERCFELLEQSARTSANKLKFFRLAFGSAGGFGAGVGGGAGGAGWAASLILAVLVGCRGFVWRRGFIKRRGFIGRWLVQHQNIGFNPIACGDTNGDQRPDTVLPGFNPPTQVCFNLGGGNPALQPYRSNSFDISFERYFSPGTAIIVAGFHKDLSDWIIDFRQVTDLSQSIENFGAGGFLQANPQVATGIFSGPVNFSDGKITGIEGTVRVNFGDFSDTLDGFGGFASVTYADAEVQNQNFNAIPIPGYSDVTWSGDIFYEKYGFRAKLAARYRGGFLSEVPNFAGGLEGAEALSETILDAQLGYTFEKEGDQGNIFFYSYRRINGLKLFSVILSHIGRNLHTCQDDLSIWVF